MAIEKGLLRFAKAALVMLLAFAGSSAALAWPGPTGPAGFVDVPLPMVGDRGTYTYHGPDGNVTLLQFEWLAATRVVGPDAVEGDANPVVSHGNAWREPAGSASTVAIRPFNETFYFGRSGFFAHHSGFLDERTLGLEGPALGLERTAEVEAKAFAPTSAHCLFANAFQGQRIGPQSDLSWSPAPCGIHGLLRDPGHWSYVGTEMLRGEQALHLRGSAFDERDAPTSVDAWFATGLPYPVKLSWSDQSIRLESFARGAAPALLGQPALATPPSPSLPVAPRTRTFLDESGVELDMSLEEALEAAAQDPSMLGFQRFLAEEPQAYVSMALDYSYADYGGWGIIVRGERHAYVFVVSEQPLAVGPVYVGWALGVPHLGFANQYYFYDGGAIDPPAYTVPPSQVPDLVPTVAGLFEQWRRLADPRFDGFGEPAWSFMYACIDASVPEFTAQIPRLVPCGEPSLVTWAGRQWAPSNVPDIGSATSQEVWGWSLLQDRGGRPERLLETFGTQELSTPVPEPQQAPPRQPGRGPGGPSWPTPNAGQAALGALVGLAAGTLYWLASGTKPGAWLLFSRLKEAVLGRHPKRAELLQLISLEPGIRFRELKRRTGFGNGVLVHHLRKLEEGHKIRALRHGNYLGYVPHGQGPAAAAHPMLQSGGARRIMEAVATRQRLSLRRLADECGLSPSTVHYHVRRLLEAGLLRVEKDHGRAYVEAAPPQAGA